MSAVARGGEMRTPVGGDRHSASVTPDFAQIHELWRFRLAPLPGYGSQPDLRPMRRWDYPSNVADAAENAHANPAGNSIQLAPTGKGKKAKKAKRDVASAKGVGVAELKLTIPSTFAGSLASESGVGNALSPRQSNTLSLMRAVDSAVQHVSSRAGGSSMLSPTAHKFDVYADVFIPRYLKDIQTIPHRLTPLSPAPIFPPKAYIQEYSTPKRVEDAHKEAMSLALLTQAAPPTLPLVGEPSGFTTNPSPGQPPPLTPETYHARFAHLLRWELDAQATQKEDIVLWKVGVKVLNWDEDTFSLQVPNVRGDTEFGGRVAVGDLVHLREVVEIKEIRKNGREEKEYITGGRGTGRAFEGRITVVRKREASVYLYSPTLKEHIQIYTMPTDATTFTNGLPVFSSKDHLPYCFNVSFLLNGNPLCVMERGVWKVSSLLKLGGNANPSPPDRSVALNLARHWLFPKDVFIQNFPSSVQAEDIKATEWYDRGLNEEQRSAVKAIALGHSTAPYLIGGPPGTGKTKTVVEAVLQILRLQPAACILLCAPSNPATDTLAQRLSVHLKPSEMFRFNEPNRTFAEVPEEIGQYTYVENTRYALPPWKTFLKYRVVVTSCIDAAHLAVAQFTNLAWMELKEENLKAFDPHSEVKVKPHWTHLIIDEAAQGSEPVLSIPTSVVIVHPRFTQNASANDNHVTVPQLVLCGDPNQLGPMICSDDARASGLDISLLERLFKRALYIPKRRATISSLLEASSDSSATLSPSEASTSGSFKRSTNLVKNYRSHPVILMPPSAMFYNDTLQPCANNGMVAWAGLPVPHLPVKFIGHEYPEATKDERATWYNLGEIRTVVATVKSMLANPVRSSPPLRPDQIGVMAPWREQVWKIREALRKEGLYEVDVGTVEDFQGREIRVVIISCVRSNSRFLEEDARKGLGMINDKKRMNVAITRARELLIVIGNGLILQTDAHWKKFLQFCIRNKLYTGPELDLGWDDGHISKLEVQLLNSDLDADDLRLLTSATRERF